MWTRKQWKSRFYLLGHLLRHLLWRRWQQPAAQGALGLMASNYRAEGIYPVGAAQRQSMNSFSNCIHCGLCDSVCDVSRDIPRHHFPGPSILPLLISRDLSLVKHTAHYVQYWDRCGDCKACEKVCPTRVPLTAMIEFVRENIERVERNL